MLNCWILRLITFPKIYIFVTVKRQNLQRSINFRNSGLTPLLTAFFFVGLLSLQERHTMHYSGYQCHFDDPSIGLSSCAYQIFRHKWQLLGTWNDNMNVSLSGWQGLCKNGNTSGIKIILYRTQKHSFYAQGQKCLKSIVSILLS